MAQEWKGRTHDETALPERCASRTGWVAVALVMVIVSLAAWSWASRGLVFHVLDTKTAPNEKLELLRSDFEAWGAAAPLVYFVFVVLEVVIAPIPGAMLYAPGGVLFGGCLGGAMTLLGNTLGAGVSCMLVRRLGGERLARWFDATRLARMGDRIERQGFWIVLLLRVNPLTSSDLVSYAAGATRIAVWKVMLGTLIGMAPLCFAQAWLAERMVLQFPWLLYPGLVLCGIYLLVAVVVISRLKSSQRPGDVDFERI